MKYRPMFYEQLLLSLKLADDPVCEHAHRLITEQIATIESLEHRIESVIAERQATQKRLIELEQELAELRKEQK